MRHRSTARRALVVLSAFLLVAAACGDDDDDAAPDGTAPTGTGADRDESADGGDTRLVIAISEEPPDLNPHGQDQSEPDSQYYEQLVQVNQDGAFVPGLAASMPTSTDDGARVWEVELREGVTFHDGTPLTAELVATNLNNLMQSESSAEESLRLGPLWDSAEAVDELTLRVNLNAGEPLFAQRLAFVHITNPDNPDPEESPIGTGPYRFVSWSRGESLILERNPDYWGEQPEVDEIEYRFIPEKATQLASFQAGELDVVNEIPFEDLAQVPDENIELVQAGVFPQVILNARGGITEDVRVRQAMSYAIDQDALNELFDNQADILNCQPLKEDYVGYNPDLDPYPYDPDRARELLAEAGADEAQFEFISPEGRYPRDREMAEAINQMWHDVGLESTLTVHGVSEDYLDAVLDQENRPTALLIQKDTEILDGANQASYLTPPGPDPSASSFPQDMAERFQEIRQIIDLEERDDAFQDFYADVCDGAYFIFLPSSPTTWLKSDKIADLNLLPAIETTWTRIAEVTVAD